MVGINDSTTYGGNDDQRYEYLKIKIIKNTEFGRFLARSTVCLGPA
jgi:hypothetical protein